RLVITAVRVVEGRREFRAGRLVARDVRRHVLRDLPRRPRPEGPGSPDVLSAGEDRVRTGWRIRIRDLRPVEADVLAAVHDRSRGEHPLGRIAVLEVRVAGARGELVETPGRVGSVIAGVATVAVDDLRPCVQAAARVRPGAV